MEVGWRVLEVHTVYFNQLLGVNINNIVLCNILFRSGNLLFQNRINLVDLQAKKKINEIFVEVEGYVSEAERFLASVPRYLKSNLEDIKRILTHRDTGVAPDEVYTAAEEFGEIFLLRFF